MDAVLFSIMCSCSASDLFILSSVCTEMRSIFTSKSFWKARFALLGLEHEQPSLQVYLRYLKLEERFLVGQRIFYQELNLKELEKFPDTEVERYSKIRRKVNRKRKEAVKALREQNLTVHHHIIREIHSLPNYYLMITKEEGRYSLIRHMESQCRQLTTKATLLENKSKVEMLNVLIQLYR